MPKRSELSEFGRSQRVHAACIVRLEAPTNIAVAGGDVSVSDGNEACRAGVVYLTSRSTPAAMWRAAMAHHNAAGEVREGCALRFVSPSVTCGRGSHDGSCTTLI